MASIVPNPPPDEPLSRVWQFGECRFDELRHELRVGEKIVEVEGKPLEVLHQLLLRAGETVRKEELLESVWPGVLVVDASLATAVSKLRKVLGDEEIIKTVPKLGYRISVPVRRTISTGAVAPVKGNGNKPSLGTSTGWPGPLAVEAARPQGRVKRRLVAGVVGTVLLVG